MTGMGVRVVAHETELPVSDAVDQLMEQWRRVRPDVDVSAMAVFGRLHRSFYRYVDQIVPVFEKHGINMAAFDVMSALRRSGPPFRLTAGELAQQTLVTTGGITLRVKRLEAAGLAIREGDPDDGRVVHVRLTPTGLKVIDAVVEEHFRNERRMLSGLSEAEQGELARLLSRVELSLDLARAGE